MDSIYHAITDLMDSNKAGALCTVVRSQGSAPRRATSKMLVYADGSIMGTVGGGEMELRVIDEARAIIASGMPRLVEYNFTDPARGDPGVCGGQVEVYIEPIHPKPLLVVIGGGHVGKAVASLAHWLGFRVAVNDDRQEFCNPEAVPDADEFYPVPMSQLTEHLEIDRFTYLVLTTRGVNVDVEGLPDLLKTEAAYIGVIGSRRRWTIARKELEAAGVPQDRINRVHSPIGLELNAETPEEIAVSILAEIIMLQRGGDGRQMALADKRDANNES